LNSPNTRNGGQPTGHPPFHSCPSWARTRTLLIPCHFGFRRRSSIERSWSGLCLHLRRYAVRWLPPSLYTFPARGLGSALPVKDSPTSRAFTDVVSGVVSSERTSGAARVRRVASYTKGHCCRSSGALVGSPESHFSHCQPARQLGAIGERSVETLVLRARPSSLPCAAMSRRRPFVPHSRPSTAAARAQLS